jgi:tetratricopeptide (TPR) repeat protein
MSLIIDALKKAQQLRIKGAEGSPMFRYPPLNKQRGISSKKQWGLIGVGLISLCILLYVLLKPVSPPLATQSYRATVLREEKPSPSITEKASPEPPKERVGLLNDGDSLPIGQALNLKESARLDTERSSYEGTTLSSRSYHHQEEKGHLEIKLSLSEKKSASLIKKVPEDEKLKMKQNVMAEKSLPSIPPAIQKEEILSNSIGVEQEGEKDQMIAPDVLNHFNVGVSLYKQREYSKAIQAYQKVIELDPSYVEAYNNLGIAYQMIGENDKAFEVYERAIEINPKYEKGYNNLGILLFLKDRHEEAFETFQKALAINSNNIESHINLGILFKKKGQLEKSIESYQTALTIDPFHKETHYNIALLYEQMENLELAIKHYQQFIQLSQKSHPELVSRVLRHCNELMRIKK